MCVPVAVGYLQEGLDPEHHDRHWQAVKGARQAYDSERERRIVSAFAPEAADLRAPAPSLSTPMAQPTTAVPALEREVPKQEGPKQEVLKKEENEAKSELERVKLEAQDCKGVGSVGAAQARTSVADAEAALKKAKDEAQRASAEVERAKAEAQLNCPTTRFMRRSR